MLKVTVLYGHPADPSAFETYYAETHMPLAMKIPNVHHAEFTQFLPSPDGSAPAYYRMAELYFENADLLGASVASEDGQAAIQDIPKFATGGVTFLTGVV